MIRRLLLLLLLVLSVPASAQQPPAAAPLEGSWALRLDGAVIMRFDLKREGEGWAGAWIKPTSFRSSGQRFGDIVMPATERTADRGRAIGEWAEITFDDPRPGEEPDQFRIRLTGTDRAELIYVGTGLPPFTLERVAAGALLGPFEEGRIYGSAPAAARPPAPGPASTVRPPPDAPTPPPSRAAVPAPSPQTPPPAEQPPVQGPPVLIGR